MMAFLPTCAVSLVLTSSLQAQEPNDAPTSEPARSAPLRDADGDGIADGADPEPGLSNLSERFVWRIESPTLTWQLDQEQFTQIERSSEHIEANLESARQAAQDALEESTQDSKLLADALTQPEPSWMQLSVNPLAVLGGIFSGVGALDALSSGIRFDGGKSTSRQERNRDFSILRRVASEEQRTREAIAERRTRLLQIQRYTRVLRNPKLQISLHLRNGGAAPLTVDRPESPVLSGARMLGVATPVDSRDRDRVVIPPGRSQAILLEVAVDDTEFWDALTGGADQIRYDPMLGAMRAFFADAPEQDLLSLIREVSAHCLPAALRLPDGARIEQSVARFDTTGRPQTARQALAAWNQAWRRQQPESRGDLIRVDDAGQVISAAGRTGSALGNGWQLVVDGKPIPLGSNADVLIHESLEIRWTRLEPLFGEVARQIEANTDAAEGLGVWAAAGLAAWKERRKLMRGEDPKAVAASIQALLDDGFSKQAPECRAALMATLGDAHKLIGSVAEARGHWEEAARYGDPQAIFALATQLLDLPDSMQKGVTRLRQAAAAGSSEAMVRLSDFEQQPGGNVRQGMIWIGQAAEAGHAPALTALAQRYESGAGLPRDVAQAASLYRLAATSGDCAAMLRLGMLYQTGRGVPRDEARASAWYLAAASGIAFEEPLR